MTKFNFPRQMLAMVVGFVVSASALAAESNPTDTVKGRPPVMAEPTVNWTDVNNSLTKDIGDTLTAVDGTISDADGDTTISSTYKWHNGASVIATGPVYTIEATDLGQSITLLATPHTDSTISDPADGLEVAGTSAGGGVIEVVPGTTITSVDIGGVLVNGHPQVDGQLEALVSCVSSCGPLTYQWRIESTPGGSMVNISGETTKFYTPKRDDQLRKIQVTVN